MLTQLAKTHAVYITTGATDSREQDVKAAFARVNLDQFITGYFCHANLGVSKGSAEFFSKILGKLNVPAASVVMVGDSFKFDIEPAIDVGIQAIWLTDENTGPDRGAINYRRIQNLQELVCENAC